MFSDITTALTSIKVASDLTTLVLNTKVNNAVTQKAIELQSAIISLQSAIMSIQTENQKLLAENDSLKQQLVNIEDWNAEAQKYNLTDIGGGVFVHAIKPGQTESGPSHWLCTHCYHNRKKSLLQRGEMTHRGWKYYCPNCKTQFVSHSTLSELKTVNGRPLPK
jgi:hypothetical protein